MLSAELFNKLRERILSRLQASEADCEQLSRYIPLQGSYERNGSPFDLSGKIFNEFIDQPEYGSLLLVGEAGSGKTLFGQQLVLNWWQRATYAELADQPLFFWVSLPGLSMDEVGGSLLHTHLTKDLNLSGDDVEELMQSNQRLVLTLDGYDEMPKRVNIYDANLFGDQRNPIQVIISCRREAFPAGVWETDFIPQTSERRLRIYHTLPFNSEQIESYIRRYEEARLSRQPEPAIEPSVIWSAERYVAELKELPQLEQLITNPFILRIVIETLPSILAEVAREGEGQTAAKQILLTRRKLYANFMEERFVRQALKFRGRLGYAARVSEIESSGKILVEVFEDYTRRLALAMLNHNVNNFEWNQSEWESKSKSENKIEREKCRKKSGWLAEFMDDKANPNLLLIRSGCPLQRIGNKFAFLHKSLLEFYAAEHLFDSALVESWVIAGCNLDAGQLEPAMVAFLADKIREEADEVESGRATIAEFQNTLLAIIDLSRFESTVWKAAANAMTILNVARFSFAGKDFRRVRIGGEEELEDGSVKCWGADLSYGLLAGVDFRKADLRYVILRHAHIDFVKLAGSCVEGMQFDALPKYKVKVAGAAELPMDEMSESHKKPQLLYSNDASGLIFRAGNMIYLFDTSTRKLLRKIGKTGFFTGFMAGMLHLYDVSHLTTSSDNRTFAWQYLTKTFMSVVREAEEVTKLSVIIADLATGRQLRSLDCQSYGKKLLNLHYFSDNQLRGWYVDGQEVKLYELETATQLARISIPIPAEVLVIYGDSDNHLFAFCFDDKSILICDCIQQEFNLQLNLKGTELVAFSHNSLFLATQQLEDPSKAVVWNVSSGGSSVLQGHEGAITCLAFSPRELLLASGSADGSIRLWDIITQSCAQHIICGHGEIIALSFHPNAQEIVSTREIQTELELIFDVWPVIERQEKIELERTNPIKKFLAMSHYGREFDVNWALAEDGVVRIERMRDAQIIMEISLGNISQACFSPKDNLFCVLHDRTVEIFYLQEKKPKISFKITDRITDEDKDYVSIACSSELAVVAGRIDHSMSIEFYELINAKRTLKVVNFTGLLSYCDNAFSLTFSFDENSLICTSIFGDVYLFDKLPQRNYSYNRIINGMTVGRIMKTGLLQTIAAIPQLTDNGNVYSGCLTVDNQFLILIKTNGLELWSLSRSRSTLKLKREDKLFCQLDACIQHIWSSTDNTKIIVFHRDGQRLTYERQMIAGKERFLLVEQPAHSMALSARHADISGIIGLGETIKRTARRRVALPPPSTHERLLRQIGHEIQGTPDVYKTPAKAIAERDGQILVPDGIIEKPFFRQEQDEFMIDEDVWVVSLVRKNPRTSAETDIRGGPQGDGRAASNHVFLILQGIEKKETDGAQDAYYTLTKGIHFFVDESKPHGTLQQAVGLIQINDMSPWNLEALASQCIFKSWSIEKSAGEELLRNVEADRSASTPYHLLGKYSPATFRGHNCLTWCEEQLVRVKIDVSSCKHWLDAVAAVPSRHLPKK
jgi:WD40 repeat protein/uncharacterized protein YjbI with pentapeptide repeats